jgi:hypothetical protein
MPEPSAPHLDDETTAALTLFNEYVAADRERARRERRIKKAERAKDEAATAIKKIDERGGNAEDKAKAETTYREALEMWKRLRDGEDVDADTVETPDASEEPPAADTSEEPPATDVNEEPPAGEAGEATTEAD